MVLELRNLIESTSHAEREDGDVYYCNVSLNSQRLGGSRYTRGIEESVELSSWLAGGAGGHNFT